MSGPKVGDPAPEFELDGTEGRFRLSDHRGERVVLLAPFMRAKPSVLRDELPRVLRGAVQHQDLRLQGEQ